MVPDISTDEQFLNRTGSRPVAADRVDEFHLRADQNRGAHGWGASVDKRFMDDETLKSDQRLLEIIASFIAQALKINEIVSQEREQWQEERRLLSTTLRGKYKFDNIIGSAHADAGSV